MLTAMKKQKKYLDIDPMTEFSDIEKLDFMQIFQQKLT